IRWGDDWVKKHDLSSLRLLGSVGEPINPEAWMWYQKTIGGGRCPIVDTWWQTETGAIMITPLPGAIPTKPGSATLPFFGVDVAGHRLGTSEIESALVAHAQVAEAAVVGRPDEMKGQAVVAFVTLKGIASPSAGLKTELRDHVGVHIGAIAKPDEIRFAEALPKTRSGKIMRRLLKEIASGQTVTGDTTTLEDFSVLAKLSEEE